MTVRVLRSSLTPLSLAIGLWSGGWACAEPPKPPAPPKDLEQVRQEMEKQQQEMEKQQVQMLEQLKTVDPKTYEQQKAQLGRQQQIRAIVNAFSAKQLDAAAARAKLKPLVEAELKAQPPGMLETQIAMLRQQLQQLEGFKRDPAAYVQHEVDLRLGLAQLMPPGGGPGSPPASPGDARQSAPQGVGKARP